jgi:hypothetical protein
LPGRHQNRVEALRRDNGIGERINGGGRVADDPLLVIRRQAIPESHAEIAEKLADVHSAILAGLSRLRGEMYAPADRAPAPGIYYAYAKAIQA